MNNFNFEDPEFLNFLFDEAIESQQLSDIKSFILPYIWDGITLLENAKIPIIEFSNNDPIGVSPKSFIYQVSNKKCEKDDADEEFKKEKEYGFTNILNKGFNTSKLLHNLCEDKKLNKDDWEIFEEYEEINSDSYSENESKEKNKNSKKKKHHNNKFHDKEMDDIFDFMFGGFGGGKGSKSNKNKNGTGKKKNDIFNNKNKNDNENSKIPEKFKDLKEDVFKKFIEENCEETNSRRYICKICKVGPKRKLEYSKIKDHFIDTHQKEYSSSKYNANCNFFLAIDYSDYLEQQEKANELNEKDNNMKQNGGNFKSKNIDKMTDDELIELLEQTGGGGMFNEDDLMKEMGKLLGGMPGGKSKGTKKRKR